MYAERAVGQLNLPAWPARLQYIGGMTSKDMAIKTIQELPDSATWEDIEERVRFVAGIDKGLADIKAGKVVAHEDVKESLKTWLAGNLVSDGCRGPQANRSVHRAGRRRCGRQPR